MNSIRNEDKTEYEVSKGLNPDIDMVELFTEQERFTLMEAQRIIEERYLRQTDPLRSPDLTRRFLQARLANEQAEIFGCLWLDTRHRVIRVQDMFYGTVDGAAVYPREVVKAALAANASACIIFHNHPSGIADPSQADLTLTKRLKDSLAMVDIRVLDHFIVAGTEHVSLAERGLL